MEFELDTSEALNRWMGPETWTTDHPTDMNRFYNFVNQYQIDHGYTINETALREEIERRVSNRGGVIGESLRDFIRRRISLAYNILDFLKQTGR